MSAMVVLSSSPPRVFARSQTPVALSSPSLENYFPSPRKIFKSAEITRESFSTNSVSARQVLGTKSSAENIPIRSPGREQYDLPAKSTSHCPSIQDDVTAFSVFDRLRPSVDMIEDEEAAEPILVQIQPSDLRKRRKEKAGTRALALKKVGARSKQRTHMESEAEAVLDIDHLESKTTSSLSNKVAAFSHSDADTSLEKLTAEDGASVKRRKIDLVNTGFGTSTVKPPISKATRKRAKSPAKKPLTITELATSNYLGGLGKEEMPNMRSLAPITASIGSHRDSKTLTMKTPKRPSKKALSKSRLKSPTTAMKTVQQQDIIFASASQLARDESPSLLKDTVEAMKQSEQLLSDPVLTQQTEIISVESTTPTARTSKFRGRKSLWVAGDRDSENALLHGDDSFDAHVDRSVRGDLCRTTVNTLKSIQDRTFDIDDLVTPITIKQAYPAVTKRAFSTKSMASDTKTADEQVGEDKTSPAKSEIPEAKKTGTKPNYEGWTDEQLKKQVKAYGFKRIRARKRMLAILEQCWQSIHGVGAQQAPTLEADSESKRILQHGAVLSNVHDLKARSTKKADRPRPRKGMLLEDGTQAKSTKVRKKVEGCGKWSGKQMRCRPSSDDPIVDVEKAESSKPAEAEEAQPLTPDTSNDSDVPLMSLTNAIKRKTRLPTPPATMPQLELAGVPTLPDLKSQILPALKYVPDADADRDHQKSPTWHEKMLMYDPIVLEDFTAWLNMKGFNNIGEDREIDILDVRSWLESNSICCLWKGGWRGNRRAKDKD